jgi:hypothetical protein
MLLTRRTFVQSSLAASLSIAAEATRAHWLLSPSDPIRVGIAGLGLSASEHIALYAAIPGARVAHLADESPTTAAAALSQLRDLGHPPPRLSRTLDALLADTSLHAISLPRELPAAGFTLRQIFSSGLPVLTDFLPTTSSLSLTSYPKSTQLHLRVGDLMYFEAALDLYAWSKRSAATSNGRNDATAELTLERRLAHAESRAVMIAALNALLVSRSLPTSQLERWAQATDNVEIAQARSVVRINLPETSIGPKSLAVSLLPRASAASVFSLRDRNGSVEVPIWRQPDAQSSLRTVMNFLNSARTGAGSSSSLDPAITASYAIDRLFRSLQITL